MSTGSALAAAEAVRTTKEDRVAEKAARDLTAKVTALRAQRRSVQAA